MRDTHVASSVVDVLRVATDGVHSRVIRDTRTSHVSQKSTTPGPKSQKIADRLISNRNNKKARISQDSEGVRGGPER